MQIEVPVNYYHTCAYTTTSTHRRNCGKSDIIMYLLSRNIHACIKLTSSHRRTGGKSARKSDMIIYFY